MDKRRVMMIAILIIGVPLFIWIQFFEVPSKAKIGEEKLQQDPLTHQYKDVTSYASAHMGDVSKTVGLLGALPFSQYKQSVELDADSLTITASYTVDEEVPKEKIQQAIVYNSLAIFTLIDHVEQIDWLVNDVTYEVTRSRVENWFGRTLVDLKDPEIFTEKVQTPLEKEGTNWFPIFTESE